MSRSTPDRLRDIIYSAELAVHHAGDLDAAALARSPGVRDAVLYRLAVVCEAANHLPTEFKALAPEIPWREMRAMRNYIVHDYWQIDLSMVVDTIAHDLEPLTNSVRRLIALSDSGAR